MLSLSFFLSLSLIERNRLSSATSARSRVTCSRIALRTRLTFLHLKLSLFVYMKSSFRRIKRMRKCLLSRIARQKTSDFHQRRDENVLISSMMSMSNDSFASESLTIECVLSSNKINYSLKSLIDIKAADYSFIDEVIAQIVYNQLQIESLTLIKAKSIWEFNDHYAKKLITHVIYSNLTVQDHTIDTAFMLITRLDQHQMILEKTWMNKIKLVISNAVASTDWFWCHITSLRQSYFNSL